MSVWSSVSKSATDINGTVSKSSSTWTDVSKSSGSSGSIVAGNPIGLLLTLTYASSISGGSGITWSSVSKN